MTPLGRLRNRIAELERRTAEELPGAGIMALDVIDGHLVTPDGRPLHNVQGLLCTDDGRPYARASGVLQVEHYESVQ